MHLPLVSVAVAVLVVSFHGTGAQVPFSIPCPKLQVVQNFDTQRVIIQKLVIISKPPEAKSQQSHLPVCLFSPTELFLGPHKQNNFLTFFLEQRGGPRLFRPSVASLVSK